MSKIFQSIGKLTLKESGDRPTMVDMVSCVGTETVPLIEKKLEGKVEVYMQDVIETMKKTLNSVSSTSFKAQQTMERTQWIKRDPA